MTSPPALPYRISTLVFISDRDGRLLLIRRRKAPNEGCWSPIGGKLDLHSGESPFECAARETAEETGFSIGTDDLHCFGYVAEKAYEGSSHWLMFLFAVRPPIPFSPAGIEEGDFGFFTRSEIDRIRIPPTDHRLVWPLWDQNRDGFTAIRADCSGGGEPDPVVEMRLS